MTSTHEMDHPRQQMLRHELDAATPLLAAWFPGESLRDSILASIEHDSDGAVRIDAPPQRPEEAISPREGDRFLFVVDDRVSCIAAYHTQSDNERRGNLTVLHRSFTLDDAASLAALRDLVTHTFAPGAVELLCVFQHGEALRLEPPFRIRSHYLARPAREIAATGLPDELAGLRAVAPDSFDFYDTYLEWYREFWRLRPELEPLVRVEPPEDLRACYRDGGVRLLELDGAICGMIAAQRRREYGLRGWRIREKVIAPPFWGRGLSIAANVLLARELSSELASELASDLALERASEPDDAMWGTISPRNPASLRSALRVGRRIVGSTYWRDLAE